MGYLSCRAESSIITCRSISSLNPTPIYKTQKRSKDKQKEEGGEDADDGPSSISGPRFHHFTYRELESATGNFSETALLGRGNHGAVYKAILPGGRPVAVKRTLNPINIHWRREYGTGEVATTGGGGRDCRTLNPINIHWRREDGATKKKIEEGITVMTKPMMKAPGGDQ